MATTTGASADAPDRAMPRGELLRALVRAHQRLVEERVLMSRMGAPADPRCERDLAAVAERISNLLSSRDERADARKRRAHLFEESPEETR